MNTPTSQFILGNRYMNFSPGHCCKITACDHSSTKHYYTPKTGPHLAQIFQSSTRGTVRQNRQAIITLVWQHRHSMSTDQSNEIVKLQTVIPTVSTKILQIVIPTESLRKY